MEYSFTAVDNLFIVNLDDNSYLLDTASPVSYSKNSKIIINGNKYLTTKPVVLVDRLKKISKRLNLKLKGIIGFDIIKNNGLYINKKTNNIIFNSKRIKGESFEFSIYKFNDFEYIKLEFETFGFGPYGKYSYILDSGISNTLVDTSLCIHSQYAYRKDLYYLALDVTYPTDFVFNSFKQNDNKIDIETGMNNEKQFIEQLADVNASGLIALNDLFKQEISIDINKKLITIK